MQYIELKNMYRDLLQIGACCHTKPFIIHLFIYYIFPYIPFRYIPWKWKTSHSIYIIRQLANGITSVNELYINYQLDALIIIYS
jgi:hypothetical protein